MGADWQGMCRLRNHHPLQKQRSKTMRARHWILVGLCVAGFGVVAGCSYISPADALAIDMAAMNAVDFARAVSVDANVPAYVKKWVGADANDWATMGLWAHHKAATPTTAAAK
jgi:hypothetical protein